MENDNNFENLPEEDRQRMNKLVNGAKKLLANEEIKHQGETLEEAQKILDADAQKDIELVEEAAEIFFSNKEKVQKLALEFEEKYCWSPSKFRAMIGVLRHALDEVYYASRLSAADESNPHPEGVTRDTRNILFFVIAEDYGAEVAREIAPLLDAYVKIGVELIRERRQISDEKKGKNQDGEESVESF
jgi:hypothetical protein